MIDIQIKGIESVRTELNTLAAILSDFTPMFQDMVNTFLREHLIRVFETDGEGRWAKRKDNLPHPLLRKTLLLYASYTLIGAPFNVLQITATHLIYGSSVPYADYHETGTSRMAARPVIETLVDDDFANETAAWIDDWLSRRI